MDVTKAISAYIERIISSVSGMKVLLLDAETTPIISISLTQSSLLSHEVYLTDRIDNTSRDRMRHLKCITLLRPTRESIDALEVELKTPKYSSYSLFFTNALKKSDIERLAEADEHDVVKEVQEYFADYVPINPALFSLNYSSPPMHLWSSSPQEWEPSALERHTNGLVALLLSLKKKPVVRYERMSSLARKLGEEVHYQMQSALPSLFDFRRTDSSPVLLILDRRNDPVTPLLSQWTYQAMVHEMIGINNGRVSLQDAEGVRPELREIVLSADQDPFFSNNLYDNFGDLGASIKQYVVDYQAKTASSSSIDTVADMKRFVEQYPEFRKLGGNVSKHVSLLGELSKKVENESLLEVSELEQSLASNESHAADLRNLYALLDSAKVKQEAKLRLAILYALRYQKYTGNEVSQVVKRLLQAGLSESRAALVFVMLNLAGAEQRQDDLFANENFFSRGKSALKGLKGVDNVYTQHSPHLLETIENLMKGRLKDTSHPYAGGSQAPPPMQKPRDVILFMIGGATYEEGRAVALANLQDTSGPGQGAHFLLGGTTIHNSKSFLDMIQNAASRFPSSITRPPLSNQPALNLGVTPVRSSEDRITSAFSSFGGNGAGSLSGQGSILDPGRLGEVRENAKDIASGLFGRLRGAVDGISLQ
ncbi:hypothetical protein CBS101457_002299 [Exobasidium rhododendri]|nr:hypothetical protein CBS101457_002299 [Exobasidium rhododendri]